MDLEIQPQVVFPGQEELIVRATTSAENPQGCQMVCFQTKNTNLGNFWRALEWKMLVYFMVIWNILWPFGNVFGNLV
jgi:hypothetical protein